VAGILIHPRHITAVKKYSDMIMVKQCNGKNKSDAEDHNQQDIDFKMI
jgi:hypothetical protein